MFGAAEVAKGEGEGRSNRSSCTGSSAPQRAVAARRKSPLAVALVLVSTLVPVLELAVAPVLVLVGPLGLALVGLLALWEGVVIWRRLVLALDMGRVLLRAGGLIANLLGQILSNHILINLIRKMMIFIRIVILIMLTAKSISLNINEID